MMYIKNKAWNFQALFFVLVFYKLDRLHIMRS